MKKFLSCIVMCLSLSVTSNAMKLQLQEHSPQIIVLSLFDGCCPHEIVDKIVCFLDYQAFTAFRQACTASNQVCENVVGGYRRYIACQAACNGHINLACRFVGICPDNMILKTCGQMFSIWHNGQDHQRLVCLMLPTDLSVQDCKNALLAAVEFASPNYVANLLSGEMLTALINQECADAVLNKSIDVQRGDLCNILKNSHLYNQASLPVMIKFVALFFKIEGISDSEDYLDLSMDVED